ncbi:MAG: GNAT family N-acetyltransferase [Chloroflexota bacterium]
MTQVHPPSADLRIADQAPPGAMLRPAMLEEQEALIALRRACGWSADSVPQQFRAMQQGRRAIWIADCDGYLVGTITVEWFADDRQLADGRTTAHISNLVVHQRYRHRGIGRGLMAAVERTAVERGCTVMTIGVDDGNTYARLLYERRGYVFLKDVRAPWGLIHILYRRLR